MGSTRRPELQRSSEHPRILLHSQEPTLRKLLAAALKPDYRVLAEPEEILSNVVDGAGQAARCSISSPSLNFFPSKTWTISSEPLSLRQRASA